jgi:hypothetical protein
MAALRRRNVVAMLLKLAGASRSAKPFEAGPGCTCESCVQAWDRHQPVKASAQHDGRRRLRLTLY